MYGIKNTLKKLTFSFLVIAGVAGCTAQITQPTNSPQKETAQAAAYEFTLEYETLEMKDGVKLAVTFYRPVAKKPGETFPALIEMVPYRKDDFFALSDYGYGAYFAKNGYVVARVDVRGTGGSDGPVPVSEYSAAEISDAEQIIDQLSKKEWSNGNVGMYGLSWSAFNSLMTAHRKPPALKAIIAAHGSIDLFYNDVHYNSGALTLDYYSHQISTDNALPQSPDYRIDETYFKNRFDKKPWIFTWMREQQDSEFWRQESIKFKEPLSVPAYVIGGLLDGYRDFVLDVKQHSTAPVIAEIGPWNHAWPEYGAPGPNYEWRQRALRWWDYWLKGVENNVLDEPRWMAFMRTGQPPTADPAIVPGYWRCEKNWPVQGSTVQRLYPQTQQKLTGAPTSKTTSDSLKYVAGAGMAAGGWWGEQTGDMSTDDRNSLVYDSAPLTQAMEIMGNPLVHLRVAADAPFYQWSVRLEDVAPDGTVSLVSGVSINPSQRHSRLSPQALTPGEPATLTAPIHFTTWRFKPGHRIRLAISNAQFPMLWPSPTPGTTRLILGKNTWFELPVVPTRDATDATCPLPAPEPSDEAPFGKTLEDTGTVFTRQRDDEKGESTFTTTSSVAWTQYDNEFRSAESYEWHVKDASPANAHFKGKRRNTFTIDGVKIDLLGEIKVESDATHFDVTFTKTLHKDGTLIREKTWIERIPRRFQ
ncbi:peptidase S15 [Pusillimonas sp. T2]|uniref:CocE/NonD family hydrolase n=1 Tax=Pusillimonas sp. T2 TaxID=1548123 RepID=UPI000B9CCCF0|nr:CocE/NonD family hydrolase [Pusillimonas sp. T2]OXR48394.1 peptidase S15 [Pusillimonas sp. T2]